MAKRAHRFFSIHAQGLVRVGAATPVVSPGDPAANAEATLALARRAHDEGCAVAVFPELGLSGYAIDDLHLQAALLEAVEAGAARLIEASRGLAPLLLVGAPVRRAGRLYNCALAIHRGRLLGVVPKSFLPNYREYYERRWFAPGAGLAGLEIEFAGQAAPFGPDLIFEASDYPGLSVHAEICEDFWAATPPSTAAALAGARVLCNLSASNVLIGKSAERSVLCRSQSMRTLSAYVFSAAGFGESTTDLAWDGQSTIHELGDCLAAGPRFSMEPLLTVADVDLERIGLERLRTPTFGDAAAAMGEPEARFRRVRFDAAPDFADLGLRRPVDRFPFTPDDPERLDQDCYEAFSIQVQGLVRRLKATGSRHLVIGVSGGLDSTHALLVACRAFDALGKPRADILGFTLPGFATGEASKGQAWDLMRALGISAAEIDIRPAATQMLKDIGHPFAEGEPVHDVAFENVQAGLRTDYLFRIANQRGGFVVGTGDLSEIALGWSTYGVGDHMSHYNVNAGVAKTLIQHLIRWVADHGLVEEAAAGVLRRVLAAEISPELVPAGAGGEVQSTQAVVGPYALQDFTLYHLTRYGLRPSKIAFLAWHAWRDPEAGAWPPGWPEGERPAYDLATIKRWTAVFLDRFFRTSQFKRSAQPNGPKVVSGGSLSPRGDWRAPSDGTAAAWLAELEAGVPAGGEG